MSDPETSGRDAPEPQLSRAETNLDQLQEGHGSAARRRIVNVANKVVGSVERKNTYAYKNINYDKEIRILKIYPDKPGSDITGRLVPCPLCDPDGQPYSDPSEHTLYTALSYYWGKDKPRNKVYIFDTDKAHEEWKGKNNTLRSFASNFHIRSNLKAALEQLRSRRAPVYLWVDALCINQEYVKERTAQVAHMHEIYTHAEKVYIWLGEGRQEENQKTFSFLTKILDLSKLEQLVERLARKEDGATWRDDLQDCKRVIDLMKVDWFSRRWVIQELALAKNAHVRRGQFEMPWVEFADAIALFMKKYDHIRRAFERPRDYSASLTSDDHLIRALDAKALGANTLVTATNNLFRRSNEGKIQQRLLSLELLVSSMLLAFEATDPKDTVFAVLQIAKDTSIADTAAEKIQSKWGALVAFSHIVPLLLLAVWNVDAITPSHFDTNKASTSDVSIRNTTLSARTSMFVFVNSCRVVITVLLLRMVYNKLLSFITKFYGYIATSFRGGNPQVKRTLDKRIEANYQKCLRDVCADFIEYCVENSKSLDILCRHWAPQPKPSLYGQTVEMPSWILPIEGHAFGGPKQVRKVRVNGDSFVGDSERRSHYSASGDLLPSYKFGKIKAGPKVIMEETKQKSGEFTTLPPQDKNELPPRFNGILEVKGFQLGTIEQCVSIVGPIISRAALELCGWTKESGFSDIDQLWRMLVANRGPDGTNAPNWYRRACTACLEWHNTQNEDLFNTNTLKDMPGTPSGKVEFLDRVQQVVWDRKFVRTRGQTGREYIGITPHKSQIYDIACILFGCSVPVILRPIPGTAEFTFVGECYVHGVMDGEAVNPIPPGTREQWFKLR